MRYFSGVGIVVSGALLIASLVSGVIADAPPQPKPAQPILQAKVTAKAGKPLVLDLSKFPGDVEWFTDDLLDADSAIIDCKKLTFASPYNGDYPIRVAVLVGGKITLAKCVISVKDGVDRPPPGPPVVDPDKVTLSDIVKQIKSIQDDLAELKKAPRPPPVVDAFQAAMQASYESDGKPSAQLAKLLAVYKMTEGIANDSANKTPSDVFKVVHKSIGGVLEEKSEAITVLPAVRAAIAAELNKTLPLGPSSTQQLDATTRAQIVSQFARVTKSLGAIQP
jgi:hypothetical protein